MKYLILMQIDPAVLERLTEDGDDIALAHIDELAEHNPRLARLAAVRAHLLERLARRGEAAAAYRQAIRESRNTAERAHLLARLRRLA